MKTKPHTIRFEENDYVFICKREGLTTAQSILNFLLGEYTKLYRVEKKSVFDIKEETTVYDAPPVKITHDDEPKQWEEPKEKKFNSYLKELKSSDEVWQIENTMKMIVKDFELSRAEKFNLEVAAKSYAEKLM